MSNKAIKDSLRLAHRALDSYQAQINALYAEKCGLKELLDMANLKRDLAKGELRAAMAETAKVHEDVTFTPQEVREMLDGVARSLLG